MSLFLKAKISQFSTLAYNVHALLTNHDSDIRNEVKMGAIPCLSLIRKHIITEEWMVSSSGSHFFNNDYYFNPSGVMRRIVTIALLCLNVFFLTKIKIKDFFFEILIRGSQN